MGADRPPPPEGDSWIEYVLGVHGGRVAGTPKAYAREELEELRAFKRSWEAGQWAHTSGVFSQPGAKTTEPP